jgi:CII-binding regulator of phage lambda lysogenization HflD
MPALPKLRYALGDKWLVEISCETMSLEMAQMILERKLQKTKKIEESLMKKISDL